MRKATQRALNTDHRVRSWHSNAIWSSVLTNFSPILQTHYLHIDRYNFKSTRIFCCIYFYLLTCILKLKKKNNIHFMGLKFDRFSLEKKTGRNVARDISSNFLAKSCPFSNQQWWLYHEATVLLDFVKKQCSLYGFKIWSIQFREEGR